METSSRPVTEKYALSRRQLSLKWECTLRGSNTRWRTKTCRQRSESTCKLKTLRIWRCRAARSRLSIARKIIQKVVTEICRRNASAPKQLSSGTLRVARQSRPAANPARSSVPTMLPKSHPTPRATNTTAPIWPSHRDNDAPRRIPELRVLAPQVCNSGWKEPQGTGIISAFRKARTIRAGTLWGSVVSSSATSPGKEPVGRSRECRGPRTAKTKKWLL